MKRYEVRQISQNWFGIYDKEKREFIIETTGIGLEVYKKLFNI